ncbi:hypothetical protein Clacol_008904 [Clathrus columnatus]|uniref:Ribosome biogenesis protein NOP53 n=1 Tax=Clathrus columnatus TaxID=1419009 RepID=A0AAV5APM9_9AGAM|nr:hypothetical protein Clacol_008904 [Clathrus columnatus]
MPKVIGAPSQHSQPSRKGKKAWRKNVDIGTIEDGLEIIRDQERVVGEAVHKKPNDALFKIDVEGDRTLQRAVPKFDMSQLKSAKLLALRSAVPAILSKPEKPKKTKLTQEEKARLLRVGKRKVKGPFNSYIDPAQLGAGSALLETTEAVKKSGTYDIWSEPTNNPALKQLKSNRNFHSPEDFLLPIIIKPAVKPPKTLHPNNTIQLPAVVEPHQGTSYQPPPTARKELILSAHEVELRKETEKAKYESIKEKMLAAVPDDGMTVDNLELQPEETGQGAEMERVTHRLTSQPRKTQKQRRKAAQLLAERRALQEEKRKRRLYGSMPSVRSLRLQLTRSLRSRQEAADARRAMRLYRLRRLGLIGQKLGKHRVRENLIDVQLDEELAENLRRLKPQGNLFRDRFLSFQHRALLEPRVPVLPKRRKTKIKEYEKHAWKRFDREN